VRLETRTVSRVGQSGSKDARESMYELHQTRGGVNITSKRRGGERSRVSTELRRTDAGPCFPLDRLVRRARELRTNQIRSDQIHQVEKEGEKEEDTQDNTLAGYTRREERNMHLPAHDCLRADEHA
jgi:hypothetical protein